MLAFYPVAGEPVATSWSEIIRPPPDNGGAPVYARAPAGAGYTPRSHYNESRPAAVSTLRPAATQRNYR
jgi:hypothetical protein